MRNTLVLTENFFEGGHSDDLLRCIKSLSNEMTVINFKDDFYSLGPEAMRRKTFEALRKSNIDTVFVNLGTTYILTPHDISLIKSFNNCHIVVIFGDAEHNFESHDRYYAQLADLCWVFGHGAAGLFELYGFPYYCRQPFAEDLYYFKRCDKIYDVSFVGGIDRADRREFIAHLQRESDLRVYIAGYGSTAGLVSIEEKNRIIRSSKIHLNFTRVVNSSRSIFQHVRQIKGRPLECAILGTFFLTEEAPGLDRLFPEKCYDTFSSPDEMLRKIRLYLLNESMREELALKALAHSRAYCSKPVSIELSKELDKIIRRRRSIFLDRDFCRQVQAAMFYNFWFFVFRCRLFCSLEALRGWTVYRNINFLDFFHQALRALYHRVIRA